MSTLRYAGFDLPLPTPELVEKFDEDYPLDEILDHCGVRTWTGRATGLGMPVSPLPNYRPKLGQFVNPAGILFWGEFLTVMPGETKAQLETASPAVFEIGGTDSLYSSEMYMLPPIPLVRFGQSLDDLYLLHLVDKRYFLANWASAGKQQITSSTTWASLYSSIASEMGISLTTSSISGAYLNPEPDSDLFSLDENGSVILNTIAENVGHRIVRRANGNFYAFTFPDAESSFNAQWTPIKNSVRFGGAVTSPKGLVPANYRVSFPRFCTKSGYDDRKPDHLRHALTSGDSWTTVVDMFSVGATSTLAGLTKTVHDTAKAVYSNCTASGDPNNSSTLTALAQRLATDYLASRNCTRIDATLNDIVKFEPDGFIVGTVIYELTETESKTHIQSPTWYEVEEYHHGTGHDPAYETPIRVKLTSGLSAGGSASAVKQEWNGAAYVDSLFVLTVYDYTSKQTGVSGNKGYARFWPDKCEYEFLSSGDSLPLIPFYLDEDLPRGEHAGATVLEWSGSVWQATGDSIEVYDTLLEIGPATYQHRGMCYFDGNSERYEVISLDFDRLLYGIAQSDWTRNNTGQNNHSVDCKLCDKDGTVRTDSDGADIDITVYLGGNAKTHPNVCEGDIIAIQLDSAGIYRCIDPRVADDPIGTIKMWVGILADLRCGWRNHTGSAGRFLVATGASPDTDCYDPSTNESSGGQSKHVHDDHVFTPTGSFSGSGSGTGSGTATLSGGGISGSGTAPVTFAASTGGTTIDTDYAIADLNIFDAGHNHTIGSSNSIPNLTFGGSPVNMTVFVAGTTGTGTANISVSEPNSGSGHKHTIPKTAIRDSITGTVSISTIAAGLSLSGSVSLSGITVSVTVSGSVSMDEITLEHNEACNIPPFYSFYVIERYK